MSRALSSARLDCLLFPTVYSYVPVLTSAAKVLIIHDVIAERFPEHVFPGRAERIRWRLKSALARGQADRLVTVSDYSRRGLVEHFGLSAERVAVAGEAPDSIFRPRPEAQLPVPVGGLGITKNHRLIACVGGFGPHKNLPRLLEAFAQLVVEPRYDDLRLVLVGDLRKRPFFVGIPGAEGQSYSTGHTGHAVVFRRLSWPDEDLADLAEPLGDAGACRR